MSDRSDRRIQQIMIKNLQPLKGKPNTRENRTLAKLIIMDEMIDAVLEDMWEELQKEL